VLAFVFPGQGSLRSGAGRPWVDQPSWSVVARLSEVIHRDLAALLLDADDHTLQATDNAQPCTFALSLVALDFARSLGLDAAIVAGHSLGEYTALVAAGAISESDGIRLVCQRGEAMRLASDANPGSMAAVLGLEPAQVADAIDGTAWVANDNAPGQVVIAGTPDGLEAASAATKAAGAARVIPLAVGGAFHSPLMAPAQPALDTALAGTAFGHAKIPVVTNVDALPHTEADWPALLSAQLCRPVRWRESLVQLASAGVTHVIELGPGDALTGMVKRTIPDVARHAGGTPAQVQAAIN
jgi:[acyl-carrier-protein] S-malonyltransferase